LPVFPPSTRVMLDTTPLGKLSRATPPADVATWRQSIEQRHELIVPEVADYEVRRELLRAGLLRSVVALDALKARFTYAPITTSAMLLAAQLWADARRRGQPTADPKELDGDVILAAQAIEAGAIVATENVGHLSRYVPAYHWSAIVA
jgi:predicted nucleic acid-binding protein